MTAVRSVLFFLAFMLITLVLSIPTATLGWVLSQERRGAIARLWAILTLAALRHICGLRYRVQGGEDLPQGAYVVLCKHQSAWETIAAGVLLPLRQTWLVKRELLSIPFFGWALAALRPIAIDRGEPRKALRHLLTEGEQRLAAGGILIVFPEGTRVAPGERGKYNPGGAMLAQRAGVPVVPIAHNAGLFWGRQAWAKHPGIIDVVIGSPLDTSGLSATEINRRTEAWIEETVARLPRSRDQALTPEQATS